MKPKVIRIRSRDANFQHIEVLLRNREKRSRHKEFVVEGVRTINAVIEFKWRIKSFLYAAGRDLSDWATEILRKSKADSHIELQPELMAAVSSKEETSELIAIVAQRDDKLEAIQPSQEMFVVVFDRPGSPGNLGSSIRSCDAFSAAGIIVTGHCIDIYDPAVVRAATGSFFAVPVIRVPSAKDVFAWKNRLNDSGISLQVIATDEKGEETPTGVDLTRPTILLMGNETAGLCKAYRDSADYTVSIPMAGSASSLNVSCATSIFLYECARQRLARSH